MRRADGVMMVTASLLVSTRVLVRVGVFSGLGSLCRVSGPGPLSLLGPGFQERPA